MTEKMPSFKEKINEIQVPFDKLDQIITNTVEEHTSKRKVSFRKKFIYSASAAVITVGLLIGSATISPVMANIVSKVPLIGSIFNESRDEGLVNVSQLGFTQIIGESKQVDDKVLTIEEAFYDGVRLTVSYSLTTESPVEADYFSLGPSFKVDGQHYEANTYREENEITSTFHTGLLEVEIAEKLPDELTLELIFGGRDSSRWEFELPIHLKTNADFIKINHHEQVAGIDLIVTEISNGLGGLKLNYKISSEDELFSILGIDFHIEDSLGNEITKLSSGGVSGSGDWNNFIGNVSFMPIDEDVKALTITPYFHLLGHDDILKDKQKYAEVFEREQFESFTVELSK